MSRVAVGIFGLVVLFSSELLAAKTAPSIVVLHQNEKSCLGYPIKTLATQPDAVVTLASCVSDSASGDVTIHLKNGDKASSIQGVRDQELAVVFFQNGTLTEKLAKEDFKTAPPGSPVLTENGDLVGLTQKCESGSEEKCEIVSIDKAENAKFLASVKEGIWGESQAPVAGDDHQTCRLFGGRRVFGGFGHHHAPVHYVHVRVVVVVQVVHVQQVVYHRPSPPPCHAPRPHYQEPCNEPPPANRPPCPDSQRHQAPASYEPPQPPPPPVYIGLYDAGASEVLVKQGITPAANSLALRQGRLTDEKNQMNAPTQPVNEANVNTYLAGLEQNRGADKASYVARREAPVASPVLLAQDKK